MKKHIQKHVDNLKQKPLEQRKKMATVFAIITTIIIIILWLVILSIFKQPTKKSTNFNQSNFTESFSQITGEFSMVGESLNTQLDEFSKIQEKIKQQQDNEINFEVETSIIPKSDIRDENSLLDVEGNTLEDDEYIVIENSELTVDESTTINTTEN